MGATVFKNMPLFAPTKFVMQHFVYYYHSGDWRLGSTIFFGKGGHEYPKVPRTIFVTPSARAILDDQKFMTPLQELNVKEICIPG